LAIWAFEFVLNIGFAILLMNNGQQQFFKYPYCLKPFSVSGHAFGHTMKLIIPLLILGIIIITVFAYRGSKTKVTTRQAGLASQKEDLTLIVEPDSAVSFGYKCIWIAVKTNDKDRVAEILGVTNVMACNWKNGIHKAYENKVFISPTVGDWTLAIGWGLVDFNPKSELDETAGFKRKLDALSKEVGEAQLFATHRITDYHSWAKSINGKTVRYYSFIGERLENILIEGKPTPIESNLNLANTFSEEAKDEKYFERADIIFPDEELVMQVAEAWSVNPTTLEGRKDISAGLGLVSR
jgi:hypothetical protein